MNFICKPAASWRGWLAKRLWAVASAGTEVVGRLRLTADEVFGEFFLAPVLVELAATHPQLRLEVVLSSRMIDLVEEGFDAAIRVGRPTPGLSCLPQGEARICYCASPEYLKKRGRPTHPGN